MQIVTAICLFFVFWSSLFLIDFYLRCSNFEKYLAFVEKHGLSVTPFQIRFYVNRYDNNVSYSSLNNLLYLISGQKSIRIIAAWFSAGAFVGLICFLITPIYLLWLLLIEISNTLTLLKWTYSPMAIFSTILPVGTTNLPILNSELEEENFKAAISSLSNSDNSLFYVPYQEHVQSGITPVIPGVNIPWNSVPIFLFVLVIAGIFHELGHAIAALSANVRLNGFGIFLFALYPGAFTEIETEELGRSSCAQKLRIFSAGIWHNIILALFGVFILWLAPFFLLPFYATGNGVLVADVNIKSGLAGSTGLMPGHIVTKINQCATTNSSDWTHCLEQLHDKQKSHTSGYLVQYSKVLPLTASPDRVKNAVGSGEIQCCSEFENVTLSSHICFRYSKQNSLKESLIDVQIPAAAAKSKDESVTITTKAPTTTPKINFAESLGILKNRLKRANFKMKNIAAEANNENSKKLNIALKKLTLKSKEINQKYSHACLPARQVTDHATCELIDEFGAIKPLPYGYVCVVPALYNGTVLVRFELKNRTRPVLFIGFLSEPLYMIDTMDITPRFNWIPFWMPKHVELFCKYLITFSLAMGLLNSVPCYGLDGQFMCRTVIDYFFVKISPSKRQKITNTILYFGTMIFTLNVAIGFIKFSINYSK